MGCKAAPNRQHIARRKTESQMNRFALLLDLTMREMLVEIEKF